MQRKITLLFIITSILVMVTGCVTINLESSNEKETSKVCDHLSEVWSKNLPPEKIKAYYRYQTLSM